MDIARRINRLLQTIETDSPDVVIGDCNMTRNSFALRSIFPDLQDAATLSGTGLLASFPIEFPLYHIDHILVSNQFHSIYY
jgi:endonuclease/exonuclease/phosphatase family metal-dependent hydrolase